MLLNDTGLALVQNRPIPERAAMQVRESIRMSLAITWSTRLQAVSVPLPGLSPYTSARRLSVEGRFDQTLMCDFLTARHPHISIDTWERAATEGRLTVDGQLVRDLKRNVRAGNVISHVVKNVVEPAVSTDMRLLHEDDRYIAIDKPAPLPVHPSGRYNRHTVVSFLKAMYPDLAFKPVHRLDADTTGVLLLARTKESANTAGQYFRNKHFSKIYLARVHGRWAGGSRLIEQAIGKSPVAKGARALESSNGLPSETAVELLQYFEEDNSSLLKVMPTTGRTNQIRLHLASCGHAIMGDHAYGQPSDASDSNRPFTSGFLCLHAHKLILSARNDDPGLDLESPLPDWALIA